MATKSTPGKTNPHKGHRIRLKNIYKNTGGKVLPNHNLLELLLFFGIPYKDTNEIAHSLIEKFGSLPNVLEADIEDLKSVKNMTENAALLIRLTADMARLYRNGQEDLAETVKNEEDLKKYILRKYSVVKTESPLLMLFDGTDRFIGSYFLNEGSHNSAEINIGKIVKIANSANSKRVVIAHSHPDGTGISSNDVVSTRNLAYRLGGVGIELAGSYVVTKEKALSIPCGEPIFPTKEKTDTTNK